MENHYNCIYMYINKINGKKYVGQAKDFYKRHTEHIRESRYELRKHYNLPFHSAIRKYGIENFDIKILAENIPTQEKMNEYEKFFIKRYNTICYNGYNISSGGSNGNNFAGKTDEEMDEIKKKISAKISGENNGMYNKKQSDETRRKMRENHANYKGKNHPRCRKVNQYDLNGNFIKTWDYIKQVKEKLNICESSVRNCCNGKYKSAGGFVWRYADKIE